MSPTETAVDGTLDVPWIVARTSGILSAA